VTGAQVLRGSVKSHRRQGPAPGGATVRIRKQRLGRDSHRRHAPRSRVSLKFMISVRAMLFRLCAARRGSARPGLRPSTAEISAATTPGPTGWPGLGPFYSRAGGGAEERYSGGTTAGVWPLCGCRGRCQMRAVVCDVCVCVCCVEICVSGGVCGVCVVWCVWHSTLPRRGRRGAGASYGRASCVRACVRPHPGHRARGVHRAPWGSECRTRPPFRVAVVRPAASPLPGDSDSRRGAHGPPFRVAAALPSESVQPAGPARRPDSRGYTSSRRRGRRLGPAHPKGPALGPRHSAGLGH
jgi:hypothetical protein